MKKLLIVSYDFAPLNGMGAKRFSIMCKYMSKYGYEPYVLTVEYPRKIPRAYQGAAGLDLEVPVDEEHLMRCGKWNNQITETMRFGEAACSILESGRIVSRCVEQVAFSWYEMCKKAYRDGRFYKIGKPDLIIATYPGIANFYVADYLSHQWGIPYVIDIRDLISQYEEVPEGYCHARKVDYVIEKYFMNRAAGIVAVTQGFQKILQDAHKKPVAVIYNGWEGKKLIDPEGKERFPVNRDTKYLYYAGSLYEHRMGSLNVLINALRLSNKHEIQYKLVIRTTGPEELVERIRRRIQQEGLKEYILLREKCSEEMIKKEREEAFLNVVLGSLSDKAYIRTTVPGKLMELLQEKQPVLAIASKNSEMGDILNKTDKGAVADTEADIEKVLKKCCGEGYYQGNIKAINFFRREYQARKLCKYLDWVYEKEHNKKSRRI